MVDQVTDDAMRDSAALVASLYKGDTDSASLLLGFYTDPEEMAALCGALAAFAAACLKTVDSVRDKVLVSDGVTLPTGDQVLKRVIVKMTSGDKT